MIKQDFQWRDWDTNLATQLLTSVLPVGYGGRMGKGGTEIVNGQPMTGSDSHPYHKKETTPNFAWSARTQGQNGPERDLEQNQT